MVQSADIRAQSHRLGQRLRSLKRDCEAALEAGLKHMGDGELAIGPVTEIGRRTSGLGECHHTLKLAPK